MNEETKKIVNGQALTEEQFQQKKQEVENTKGMQLVEVAPNQYKIRIQE